jgi:hypothetical protein
LFLRWWLTCKHIQKGNAWFLCERLNRCRTELAVSCGWEEFFKEKAHWRFMARFLHLGRDSENKVVFIQSYILRTVQFSWCYCGLCIQFLETSWIIYLFSLLLWVYYTSLERGTAITRWATCFILYWLYTLVMQPWKTFFFKHIGGLGNVQRNKEKKKGEFIGCQISSN